MVARTLKPDDCDRFEMAGRMYEAIDIQSAIENGQLKDIRDVMSYVKRSSSGINKLIKIETWIMTENCCVDIPASIRDDLARSWHE